MSLSTRFKAPLCSPSSPINPLTTRRTVGRTFVMLRPDRLSRAPAYRCRARRPTLEVTMNAVDIGREFLHIPEHDRTRPRQFDANILDNFARLGLMTRIRSDRPTASSTLWVMKSTVGRRRSHRLPDPSGLEGASAHPAHRTVRPSESAMDRGQVCESARRAGACRLTVVAATCPSLRSI